MPKQYTVKAGDCISSIAFETGFFADTLSELPENANLKQLRKNLNVLQPGDVVFIPDKREKFHEGKTGARHVFRRKGVPARLSLRILRDDAPRANVPYTLTIDGRVMSGRTGPKGEIDVTISPNAMSGILKVGPPEDLDEYNLDLGHLQPADNIAGVQSRLRNLGFHCEGEDGQLGPVTREAISAFQRKHKLPVTGEMDAAFQAKIAKVHDEV